MANNYKPGWLLSSNSLLNLPNKLFHALFTNDDNVRKGAFQKVCTKKSDSNSIHARARAHTHAHGYFDIPIASSVCIFFPEKNGYGSKRALARSCFWTCKHAQRMVMNQFEWGNIESVVSSVDQSKREAFGEGRENLKVKLLKCIKGVNWLKCTNGSHNGDNREIR